MNYLLRESFLNSRHLFFMGVLFLFLGFALLTYYFYQPNHTIQLREAEGFLRQNSKESAKEALRLFNSILAQNIEKDINQKAKYGIAASLELLGDNKAALRYYKELQREEITDSSLRDKIDYALGSFYLYLKQEQEGRILLDATVLRTKDDRLKSKIFTSYGLYYLRKRQSREAEKNFSTALRYDATNTRAEEGQAQAIKGQGLDWMAYKYYDDYLFSTANLDSKNRNKVVKKVEREVLDSGLKAYYNESYKNAINFFDKLCRTSKDNAMREEARFWMGESYRALGKNTKAIKAYKRVLDSSFMEKDDVALFKIALIYFQENKTKQALNLFNKLQNEYPESRYSKKAKSYLEELKQEEEEKEKIKSSEIIDLEPTIEEKPASTEEE